MTRITVNSYSKIQEWKTMGTAKQYIRDDSTTYLFELPVLEEIIARSHAGGGVTNAESATM